MIDLIGALALLLWGLRMVKTGVSRAFGPQLRRVLATATRTRVAAFGSGLIATLALQSSTAIALMTASFAGIGLINSMMAQAVMLGANVGTSLVTRLLALDLHWLSPVLIAVGFLAFSFSKSKPKRGLARAVLGLGLMLLSLDLLGTATKPMLGSPTLLALMATLDAVPVVAVAIAAVLALSCSSSLAVVLFTMALAAGGGVSPQTGIALVLGANLGGAVPPVLATLTQPALARRVTIGNLLVRLAGALAVLAFIQPATAAFLSVFHSDPAALVVDTHILFNVLLSLVMLPLLGPMAKLMRQMLPEAQIAETGPKHLDKRFLDQPAQALAAAARETLRIGDRVALMLERNLQALKKNDASLCAGIGGLDDEVDELNEAVKLYLSKLNRMPMPEREARRADEIISYAINLEHVGDIVDTNLRDMIEKKIRYQLTFSPEGQEEIEAFYKITIDNLRLAQSVLISGDEQLARQLMEAKTDIRDYEERSTSNHLARLRDGRAESVQTSSLHLDILRDLKRINAYVAAIAYPILEQAGALRKSRLI
ncbi:Na/Pi cotransporter family protein [Stappia sp.]|jgi:phosphate:Na+ symporter|uniref:Na/Pi cotransporter family protein n=1 Tax=Stappia sp. TaxID=1870903 RepID=UPI003A9A575A